MNYVQVQIVITCGLIGALLAYIAWRIGERKFTYTCTNCSFVGPSRHLWNTTLGWLGASVLAWSLLLFWSARLLVRRSVGQGGEDSDKIGEGLGGLLGGSALLTSSWAMLILATVLIATWLLSSRPACLRCRETRIIRDQASARESAGAA